jgi:hypothetical protein
MPIQGISSTIRYSRSKLNLEEKNTYSQNTKIHAFREARIPPTEGAAPPRPARRSQQVARPSGPAHAHVARNFLVVLDANLTAKDRSRIQASRGTPIRLGITPTLPQR